MNLKDILAKVAKGESLTDAEKKFLGEYDAEKASNDAVAAYRRKADEKLAKAEKDRDDLKTQVDAIQQQLDEKKNSGKTEMDKVQEQNKLLADQLAQITKRFEDSDKEKAQLSRSQAINGIREKAGIKFIPGINEAIMSGAFASAFEGITDLADDNQVKPVIDAFKAANKAVIADLSGHGAGGSPHVGGGHVDSSKNPFKTETFNLTKQAELIKQNPAEASRMAAEAGVKLEV